jgi:AcrR family transcriptional regulator
MSKQKLSINKPSVVLREVKCRNAVATREAILEAARNHFLRHGYDNAGLRAIAGDAGIDAALISRYFGSKKQLFAEVLESTREESTDILIGEKTTCGKRIADKVLGSSCTTANKTAFIGLMTNSSTSPEASALVHKHIEKYFMKPFAEWLGGPNAKDTAWLMVSMLMGVVIMNTIKPDKKNSGVDRLAVMLQAIIDSA